MALWRTALHSPRVWRPRSACCRGCRARDMATRRRSSRCRYGRSVMTYMGCLIGAPGADPDALPPTEVDDFDDCGEDEDFNIDDCEEDEECMAPGSVAVMRQSTRRAPTPAEPAAKAASKMQAWSI
mmetsp:Transcript_6534/g.18212  ORF Transcript_6534/g.18212 Transcript_6534/m.18212 type:complete len:126 (+) Transcript_6534:835-1212(+)